MSAIASQPRTVRIAALIGAVEAIGLAAFAVSILAFEAGSTTTGIKGSELAPGILVSLYLLFAVLIVAVSYWFATGRSAARTPFVLIQLFALVVSQPLFSGASARAVAVVIVLAALVALACALSPSARGAFR